MKSPGGDPPGFPCAENESGRVIGRFQAFEMPQKNYFFLPAAFFLAGLAAFFAAAFFFAIELTP
jgi:hypothetical protein